MGFCNLALKSPPIRLAQVPPKCPSRIRGSCVGLPTCPKNEGRELRASCWIALIPAKCRSQIRSPRVGLTRSRQSAGREFGAFVSDCPDPDKLSVANSGPSCRVVQIPTKCRPRIRSLRVGLTRSRQSADRGFGAVVWIVQIPTNRKSRRLRRTQIRGSRMLQFLSDPSALCAW